MKETRQLSIGGYAFVLEADAAEELRRYMDAMENHYLTQEGGKEILEGIEERIAELLLDKHAQVITIFHVQEVINVIGRPEKIDEEDADAPAGNGQASPKRLYRDLAGKQIAGVCAGLAAYLGMDVALMRMIWAIAAIVLFFSGAKDGIWSMTVPAIYFVFWAAMPPARTAQDRWAMKGDSGTINDIRRNVKTGIKEMGETARNVATEARSSEAVRGAGRIIALVVGLVILIIGVSGLASASVVALKGDALFGAQIAEWMADITEEYPGIFTLTAEPWTMILVTLAVLLPFVWLLYGGIQLIFGFESPSWHPGLCIFVVWLIILVVVLVLGFAGVLSFFNPVEIA